MRAILGAICAGALAALAGSSLALNLAIPMTIGFWLVVLTLSATAVWGLAR